MKAALGWIKDIIIAVIIAAIILTFFKPIIIQQESMQPTFYANDYVIVSKQAYTMFGEAEHGDVIVFVSELLDSSGKPKNLIKRVIGVPGDTIEISNGYVIRNGTVIKESYVAEAGVSGDMDPITVEEGKLFVMGDNRAVSQDSRSLEIGQIDQSTVLGKVVCRLWPISKIGLF